MDRMEETKALRARTDVHYNCCQSVLVPFCKECGLSHEQAYQLGAHFGSGMRHGSTCGGGDRGPDGAGPDRPGAGGLQPPAAEVPEKNQVLDCAGLLALAKERGEVRKPHCDRMVYDAVELLEELLPDRM